MSSLAKTDVKVADEVWIVVALLQRESPTAEDFSIEQIMDRARVEKVVSDLRPGFYVHVVQHCVANRAPNPGRYRMLFETAKDRRRLYRKGDTYNPNREGSKTVPEKEDLPIAYQDLVGWYKNEFCTSAPSSAETD